MDKLPGDIKPHWFGVVRRLQSVTAKVRDLAVVSIEIIIDSEGRPVLWTEPVLSRLEPQTRSARLVELWSALFTPAKADQGDEISAADKPA